MKIEFNTTNKVNKDPIVITLSGIGFSRLNQDRYAFREFFRQKLYGTGATINEINEIADAVQSEKVIFIAVDGSDARQGYINGVLIETPTQHVEFFGAMVSLDTIKEQEGYVEDTLEVDTLEEVIEQTQIKLHKQIEAYWNAEVPVDQPEFGKETQEELDAWADEIILASETLPVKLWSKPSFNDWVVGVLEGEDSKDDDGNRELESHYVNEQLESLSLFYIDGTEEILYYSNA